MYGKIGAAKDREVKKKASKKYNSEKKKTDRSWIWTQCLGIGKSSTSQMST